MGDSKAEIKARAVYEKAKGEARTACLMAHYVAKIVAKAKANVFYNKAKADADAISEKAEAKAWALYEKAETEARLIYNNAGKNKGR